MKQVESSVRAFARKLRFEGVLQAPRSIRRQDSGASEQGGANGEGATLKNREMTSFSPLPTTRESFCDSNASGFTENRTCSPREARRGTPLDVNYVSDWQIHSPRNVLLLLGNGRIQAQNDCTSDCLSPGLTPEKPESSPPARFSLFTSPDLSGSCDFACPPLNPSHASSSSPLSLSFQPIHYAQVRYSTSFHFHLVPVLDDIASRTSHGSDSTTVFIEAWIEIVLGAQGNVETAAESQSRRRRWNRSSSSSRRCCDDQASSTTDLYVYSLLIRSSATRLTVRVYCFRRDARSSLGRSSETTSNSHSLLSPPRRSRK
jgi:hypothetical protein